jgi:hypothetical protein
VVSFKYRPLYSQGKIRLYPPDRRLDEAPRVVQVMVAKRGKSLALLGIKPPVVQPVT